jgi:hypothetical protein
MLGPNNFGHWLIIHLTNNQEHWDKTENPSNIDETNANKDEKSRSR